MVNFFCTVNFSANAFFWLPSQMAFCTAQAACRTAPPKVRILCMGTGNAYYLVSITRPPSPCPNARSTVTSGRSGHLQGIFNPFSGHFGGISSLPREYLRCIALRCGTVYCISRRNIQDSPHTLVFIRAACGCNPSCQGKNQADFSWKLPALLLFFSWKQLFPCDSGSIIPKPGGHLGGSLLETAQPILIEASGCP